MIIMDADFSHHVCASPSFIVILNVSIASLNLSLNLFGKILLSSFLRL